VLCVLKAVADAYYVLSDLGRRKEYDALYVSQPHTDDPDASSNFFSNFANMFAGTQSTGQNNAGPARPDAEGVFTDVFEEASSHLSLENPN
jgi:DnaJ-class molecular chaperone